MSTNRLCDFGEVEALVEAGRFLLLAGEESLLRRLGPGNWIGGTTVNFMGPAGGVTDREHIFVTDLTSVVESAVIKHYDRRTLPDFPKDYSDRGFSVIIVPGLSEIHAVFAHEVQEYPSIFDMPLIGWVSGVHISEIGKKKPKVFAGSGKPLTEEAVVMHVRLKPRLAALIDIINLFTQGDGDTITSHDDGLSADHCMINGAPARLSDYIAKHEIDTRLPLVANFNETMINVSVRSVDQERHRVDFYAPVYKGVMYRFAKPVENYTAAFEKFVSESPKIVPAYSCNCILNYVYAGLEGKRTSGFTGPVTFGEIAYILLNQTLVYLTITKIA